MSVRVLFITHVSTMAGANRSMFQLIKELKEIYNVYPVVLCPYRNSKINIQDKLEEINVEFFELHIRFFKSPNPSLYSFISYLKYLLKHRNYYKRLLHYRFDLIHSNSSVIDLGCYLSKQLKCKHVWHLREFGDLDYSLYPLGGILYERFVYRHADAFIAISEKVRKHFYNKINHRKISLIYNGIEEISFTKFAKHSNSIINFVCVGIIHPSKNQKEIVNAVSVLVNKYNQHGFHVTFIGIHSLPYVKELTELIKNNNIEDYISIHKEVDGVQDFLSNMDVGIMSSHAEAFGRVTVEYMLQKLLVIANDSGANPELIQDGVTGLIYEHGDYSSLANKMKEVISSPSIINKITNNALEQSRKKFLSTHNTKDIFSLYQKILVNN